MPGKLKANITEYEKKPNAKLLLEKKTAIYKRLPFQLNQSLMREILITF